MDCPICGSYGKTYASKPLGTVKIRYRQCEECNHKYRTFEEIDSNPLVREHKRIPRYPLVDATNITCPDCNGDDLKHDRVTTKGELVTHLYTCKGCQFKFGIEATGGDPISAARKKAAQKTRILCPICAATTQQKSRTKTIAGATIRRECQGCGHRFTYRTFDDGRPPEPPLVLGREIDHRVKP